MKPSDFGKAYEELDVIPGDIVKHTRYHGWQGKVLEPEHYSRDGNTFVYYYKNESINKAEETWPKYLEVVERQPRGDVKQPENTEEPHLLFLSELE